ncbi:MAG: YdeI/OmpD-associated family protein [Ferruginibacter sp.]
MHTFKAIIDIIGINPFVYLPEKVLSAVLKSAQKDKGPIPVYGTVNGASFKQTLVKYSGAWRLYINRPMLHASGSKLGDCIRVRIAFDPSERTIPFHPKLKAALAASKDANAKFKQLPPSRQKEIKRYIHHLKTDESVERNIAKLLDHLRGKAVFAGRQLP